MSDRNAALIEEPYSKPARARASAEIPPTRRLGSYQPIIDNRAPVTQLVPTRYVLLPIASALTGYSVKAMQRKIATGVWPEDKVWRRAPDGRICVDLEGYAKWVEGH